MKLPNGFTIQSENPKELNNNDLNKIHEIEQDMWAREESIGEYLICNNCNIIYSKEDIFKNIERAIYLKTVLQIEQILQIKKIKCNICGKNTKHIYGNDYIKNIKIRYNGNISFLTTYRDINGEIRGFFDGYISDFETIFEKEFKYYYNEIGIDIIISMIEKVIGKQLPQELLICSSLGMEEKYKNFFILYEMMLEFFTNINKKIPYNITGISESSIGSNTHAIYHTVGAKRIGISINENYSLKIQNIKKGFISDIFIHENITKDYIEAMNIPIKEFLRQNKRKMKEILLNSK